MQGEHEDLRALCARIGTTGHSSLCAATVPHAGHSGSLTPIFSSLCSGEKSTVCEATLGGEDTLCPPRIYGKGGGRGGGRRARMRRKRRWTPWRWRPTRRRSWPRSWSWPWSWSRSWSRASAWMASLAAASLPRQTLRCTLRTTSTGEYGNPTGGQRRCGSLLTCLNFIPGSRANGMERLRPMWQLFTASRNPVPRTTEIRRTPSTAVCVRV